ncbi:MAG TPA: ABC transporter ATP-binding protein [Methylomirabilota bacterium]|jgi:ABC-type Fe3+/spermidine/putrescine transport system ATPase subunit|nr:ABC transporter ATP-binding protein [Methylomirabilota bacterium]
MTRVRVDGVTKRFGDAVALDGVTLDLPPGELFTLLGPSGCGKTTLLRIVAGLLAQDAGSIAFDGEPVDAVPPYRRNIGVVFQGYAIFPHLTVRQNIAYGLRARRLAAAAIEAKVAAAARMVQLEPLLDRMPAALSGGQQQRVVLARALVIEPRLLLMDEPLSNLDARLRVEMRGVIRRLQRTLGITTLYVTHDQEEALAISDTIAVMDRGRVIQTGAPGGLYRMPRTRFVAEFLGGMNVLPGRITGARRGARAAVAVSGLELPWAALTPEDASGAGEAVWVGVRPESLRLEPPPGEADGWNHAAGTVTEVTYLGAVVRYEVQLGPATSLTVDVPDPDPGALRRVGETVHLWCDPARVRLLGPAT